MLCIVVLPCCSLNEDTVDFLSWLCLMSLAVASRNVTEPTTQMFDNDLPKILGELLYTYVDLPSGLMESMGCYSSWSLLFMMKVMIGAFISDCCRVVIALIILFPSKCCCGGFSAIS